MGQIIPNEESWIAFSPTPPASMAAPSLATDLTPATDLTDLVITLNPSTTGNTLPTPRLKRRFETSISGTATGSCTGDFYRDNENDDAAWELLPRGTKGVLYISRFGGTGPEARPIVGEKVEIWPIDVSARTPGALSNNTVQMFTMTAGVPEEPNEDAVVAV